MALGWGFEGFGFEPQPELKTIFGSGLAKKSNYNSQAD